MECQDITNITIPGSVEIIGENAFMGFYFENLSSVTIEDGVKRIEAGAFSFCTHLENITIPDSVTYIGESAFRGCLQMADDDGFIIYDDVLYGYEGSAMNVIIPYGVKRIEQSAFEFNFDLLSVVIPDSVTRIECQAFTNCTKLTSVTIPDSVTYIGFNNFRSPYLADDDGFIIIRNTLYVYLGNAAIVNIPYGVTNIDDFAFSGNTNIVRVTIPSTVTRIGNYAFHDCNNLTRITIPNSVRTIGHHAFYNTGLSNITIPESVTNIEDYAFRNCLQLTNVTVSNPDTVFGMDVFHQCPSSLNLRGDIDSTTRRYANENDILFVAMVKMDEPDFVLPSDLTTIEAGAFSGIDATVIYIPDTVTSIGSKAFSNCDRLSQIRIPAFVRTIPGDLFEGIPTDSFIIFGTPGSAAQTFADNAGIVFVEE